MLLKYNLYFVTTSVSHVGPGNGHRQGYIEGHVLNIHSGKQGWFFHLCYVFSLTQESQSGEKLSAESKMECDAITS